MVGYRAPQTHVDPHPYASPKEILPKWVYCEECDRNLIGKDLPNHLRSKKHRLAVEALKNPPPAKIVNAGVDANGPAFTATADGNTSWYVFFVFLQTSVKLFFLKLSFAETHRSHASLTSKI